MEKFILKKKYLLLFIISVCFVNSTISYGQTDLTKYLPKGYNKKGGVDYTAYLQKGLNENKNVLFPNFPILINKKGLNLQSNQTLNFQKNSSLIMQPNAETNYGILNVVNVNNVKIYHPVLIGDKDSHLSTKGEWGMGINILSSSNITIQNPNIRKTWGDGIYIGEISNANRKNIKKETFTNTNITIKGGIVDNCLRNGISIISGMNVVIDGTTIKNINSKAPKAAIDIEPNNKSNIINDISIKNIVTKNNFNGIVIMLTNIIQSKDVNIGTILIQNHTDYDSKSSLTISNSSKKLTAKQGLKKLKGEIKLERNNYYGTGKIYTHHKTNQYNPTIKIDKINYYKKINNKYLINSEFNKALKESIKNDEKVIYK